VARSAAAADEGDPDARDPAGTMNGCSPEVVNDALGAFGAALLTT
jgi:hypothetical protein